MTDGGRFHRHHMLTVAGPYVWWVRLLRRPVFHTTDFPKMDKSPYPYCPCSVSAALSDSTAHENCYTMSALSVLHRWTGLTLFYRTWKGAPDDEHK